MAKNKFEPSALFYCVFLLTQAYTSKTYEVKPVRSACIPSERDALLAVKAGLVDPKNRLSSWKGQDCCQWRGVTCSNASTHVVQLDLRNTYQYEEGSLIDWSYALSGEIRSSILRLQHLNYLDLSYNNFSGANIPEFIGSLKELTYLNLTSAGFVGRIPPQIGNLSNIQYLDLSVGWISNLYSHDITWLTHLSSLNYLDLSFVNLSSVINWKGLDTLPRLKTLHLKWCRLHDTSFTLSRVNFTRLEALDLSDNWLINPLSLNWVSNLTSLNYIDISSNELDGRVMNILRKVNSIETLHLWGNNLMNMKARDLKNLTNLKILDLELTQISGDITEFIIESSLPHELQLLNLGLNNLNGNLSSWIGHMTSLSSLVLSGNNLNGLIPLSVRKLTQLVELDLFGNNFHGTITEKYLSSMTSLDYLDLSGNHLNIIINANWMPPFRLSVASLSSCNLGPKFPQWFKSQVHISYLDISNTSIADELPAWFWHVYSTAHYLDLSQNNLTGWILEDLEFMLVTTLLLNDNKFQGSVPKLPKTLQVLDLSRNALSGSLPLNMKDVPLMILALADNLLNGSISQSICQLQGLRMLDLSRNFFVGKFPNCWDNNLEATKINYSKEGSRNQTLIQQCVLQILTLSYNNFSGEFSEYIKYCSYLELLDLGNNNFFGNIPSWIGEKLPYLGFLLLGSNKLSGTIPNQLFELSQLQVLDLSHNNLKGTVPRSLKSLKAMTITNDAYSNDPFEIVTYKNRFYMSTVTEVLTKGQVLDFKTNIKDFRSLDLSCNGLVGYIPEEIGALIGLVNLNLSKNKLSGNIPVSIGYLQSLESLDLSMNKLTGLIPSCLSNLTFLSHLNLSYNNLSGRIPSGHQLQTLDDPSIYEGNSGLCGFPLPTECSVNSTTSQTLVLEEDGYEIYVGAIVGFAIGVWIVYGVLLLTKSVRVVYFLFLDKMYDRLYVFLFLNWARITLNRDHNC